MNTPKITLRNEPSYTFGSVDNDRSYPNEWLIEQEYRPSSIHGVFLDDKPFAVIGAGGGGTGIHDHSLLLLEESAYIAVGDQIIAIDLKEEKMKWNLQIDDATCFGLYFSKKHNVMISHGELCISRFDSEGRVLWQSGGRDIFTEGFSLLDNCIHAIDFDGKDYQFNYEDGK